MNEEVFRHAEKLAELPHQIHYFLDETTDGEPWFVAIVPELPGCISDGETIEEAHKNIRDAKADFIYLLLRDGLDVPKPKMLGGDTRVNMLGVMASDSAGKEPVQGQIVYPAPA